MNKAEPPGETFTDVKDSFSYGSRTDLAFKFLKGLSPEDAAEFFMVLLAKLGETIDDGDAGRLIDHAYAWQARAYASAERRVVYDDGPFAPLQKPLARSRLALFTSSGHFVAGDDPHPFGVADMTQDEAIARIDDFLRAAPQLSVIPATTPSGQLRVRHGGYDIRAAVQDPNVVFPLDRLRGLAIEGTLGELAPRPTPLWGRPRRHGCDGRSRRSGRRSCATRGWMPCCWYRPDRSVTCPSDTLRGPSKRRACRP